MTCSAPIPIRDGAETSAGGLRRRHIQRRRGIRGKYPIGHKPTGAVTVPGMPLEIDAVRACYPALDEGFAHFDAAAGSLVARSVADAAHAVMTAAVANRSTAFAPGRRSIQIVEEARAAVADLLGATPTGVVFGSSATSLTYLVSRTLA